MWKLCIKCLTYYTSCHACVMPDWHFFCLLKEDRAWLSECAAGGPTFRVFLLGIRWLM